ncbi:unnamed protein product [Acanthoscelides obtectus]|uniref:DDE Tnp4 domain-containing protein n=2 Tax=Acanthoscelides obtectus TaxID=200917 RepID=A0A9P0PR21_ACAOB|nr:unnamed protein product [Acanthoscelides obtectus]CAK1632258.1 Protein ALP1-like [Acanthoscelides obtectus]
MEIQFVFVSDGTHSCNAIDRTSMEKADLTDDMDRKGNFKMMVENHLPDNADCEDFQSVGMIQQLFIKSEDIHNDEANPTTALDREPDVNWEIDNKNTLEVDVNMKTDNAINNLNECDINTNLITELVLSRIKNEYSELDNIDEYTASNNEDLNVHLSEVNPAIDVDSEDVKGTEITGGFTTKSEGGVGVDATSDVTLNGYLASGCSFTDLYYSYRLGISTISKIVREVCDILWSCLVEECIPKLTKERFESVAAGFEKRANFFHCIGAVDGKHIRIVKPEFSGSLYYNYKSYFSVVLMAVADSNYRFIYVDVGAYGSERDSSIFKESSLWKSIQKKSLELPSAKPLSGSEASNVPYFLIGDEAFGLNINLLRPFGGKELSQKKRIFNYRLSRARRYVECSNSNKWRILHRSLNVNTDFAVSIVKACVVLHNFVRERDGYNFEDTMTVVGMNDLPAQANMQGGRAANNIRNVLSDYFLTEVGKVSWQLSKI